MANFFEERRDRLGVNRTALAARIGTTAEAVRLWEIEKSIPRQPISTLATAYEVTEHRMETEVMALRRRVEAKREAAPVK